MLTTPRGRARPGRPARRPARRPRRPTERGAAAVEFALVAPLLLLLVFGIISYGFMLSFRQGLSQATAEGARAASVTLVPASSTGTSTSAAQVTAARAAVNDALAGFEVTCVDAVLRRGAKAVGTCTITVAPCTNAADRRCATVGLDYRYRDNALVPTLPGVGLVVPARLAFTMSAQVN